MLNSSVVSSTTCVSEPCAADFLELSYTSALLLTTPFTASITEHPDFEGACRWGFDFYFEEMYDVLPGKESFPENLVFVEKRYTAAQVKKEVMSNMSGLSEGSTLPLCVGVSLGWLSALALVQPQEAQQGLRLLTTFVYRLRFTSLTRQESHANLQQGRDEQ